MSDFYSWLYSSPQAAPTSQPSTIYGSSQINPMYSNYQGSQTYAPKSMPQTSSSLVSSTGVPFAINNTPQTTGGGGGGGGGGSGSNGQLRGASTGDDPATQARNSYFSYLDQLSGNLPQTQKDMESQVNNLYGSQQSSLNTGLQNTLGSLDLSKQNIASNQASSLRDLDTAMRNQLQAGNVYLGARGASDSSAANQYSYALAKAGTQNRSNVLQQANQLYAQVDNQINQAKTTAQDQLNQLDTWKNNQLLQISQYIQSLRGNIDQAKANYVQQYLSNLDNQIQGYKNMVAQWIVSKGQSLDQVKSQLQQLGVGPTANFSQPNLPGIGYNSADNSGTMLFGNYGLKKDNRSMTGY